MTEAEMSIGVLSLTGDVCIYMFLKGTFKLVLFLEKNPFF
jgi:hypothetical protein